MKRRRLLGGFMQHLCYMLLLVLVIFTQGGGRTEERYHIVETIEGYLEDLKTEQPAPHSILIENMESIDDFWDWTEVSAAAHAGTHAVAPPSWLPPPLRPAPSPP